MLGHICQSDEFETYTSAIGTLRLQTIQLDKDSQKGVVLQNLQAWKHIGPRSVGFSEHDLRLSIQSANHKLDRNDDTTDEEALLLTVKSLNSFTMCTGYR